jgi:hypothetical protein
MLKIISTAFVCGTLIFAVPAQASFDSACIDWLTAQGEDNLAVREFLDDRAATIRLIYPHSRALSNTEIEVWVDLTHDLLMTVSFSDGTRRMLQNDRRSQDILIERLKYAKVTRAIYRPQSLVRLGNALKEACLELRLSASCEIYDHYKGLMDSSPRPFSRPQEQVLKWAILGVEPGKALASAFRQYSAIERPLRLERLRRMRLAQAERLIESVFPSLEALVIFEIVVRPRAQAAFESFRRDTAKNSL